MPEFVRKGVIDAGKIEPIMSGHDDDRIRAGFAAHLREVVVLINEELRRAGSTIVFSAENICNANMYRKPNRLMRRVVSAIDRGKSVPGMLHKEQIETAVEAILSIINSPNPMKVILGAMQCGKTGTQLALFFLGPVALVHDGSKFYPINLGIPSLSSAEQTREEREAFLQMYGEIVITSGVLATTLNEFEDQTERDTKILRHLIASGATLANYNEMLENCRDDLDDHTRALLDSIDADRTNHRDLIANQTRSNKKINIEIVSSVVRALGAQNYRMAFIVDEVHFGADKNSVLKKFVADLQDMIFAEPNRHVFVGVSATPYNMLALETVDVIRHRVSPSYCGPNYALGLPLSPGVNTVEPEVMSIDEIAELASVGGPDIDIGVMMDFSTTKFSKWAEKNEYRGKHWQYVTECREKIRAVIDQVLITPHRGDHRTVALCVRFGNNNDQAQDIIDLLYPEGHSEAEIFLYNAMAKENRKSSVAQWVMSKFTKGNRFIVVVTGSARMADAFPTTHREMPLRWAFMDYTIETTNQASLLQAMYGRACGYGKVIDGIPPMVVLSEANTDAMRDYQDTLGEYVMNPLKNVKKIGSAKKRWSHNLDVHIDTITDPFIREAMDRLSQRVTHLLGDRESLYGLTPRDYPIWEVFDEKVLAYIEQNPRSIASNLVGDFSLLRPAYHRKAPTDKLFYANVDRAKQNGKVGFRKYTPNRSGGSDVLDRGSRRTAADPNNGKLRVPQVHVTKNPETGLWDAVGVTFALMKRTRIGGSTTTCALGDNSVFSPHRTYGDLCKAADSKCLDEDGIAMAIQVESITEFQANNLRLRALAPTAYKMAGGAA